MFTLLISKVSLSSLSLSLSDRVKFVGLFVVLLAGYTTARDLWDILGDLDKTLVRTLISNWCSGNIHLAICLLYIYGDHLKEPLCAPVNLGHHKLGNFSRGEGNIVYP